MQKIITYAGITVFMLIPFVSSAQADSSLIGKIKSLDTANILKMDTAAVPEDSFTTKIRELRREKHGLTAENIIKMKLQEERPKDTAHARAYQALYEEVTKGRTSKLIENSLINLYRKYFTEQEVDDLIAFYKTPAGRKMDSAYILLMVESIKDAEQLVKLASERISRK